MEEDREDENGVKEATTTPTKIKRGKIPKKCEINIRMKARERGETHTTTLWTWKSTGVKLTTNGLEETDQ
jgi:hypothetical protein